VTNNRSQPLGISHDFYCYYYQQQVTEINDEVSGGLKKYYIISVQKYCCVMAMSQLIINY